MKKSCASGLVVLSIASGIAFAQATITEETQVIKTYPFSGPDPTPIMTRSSMWGSGPRLYPYYFFDELSSTGTDKIWKVVRMENPYLTVLVLPEEGGKVLAAIEKSTGQPFIYYNHVRKFRQIALRGPWTSGGIEFNFGIVGHAPSGATPVDYVTRTNPDGSVSCVVGTMDLASRTHWRVTITLPPDKAYFETRPLLYNPQALDQSYYVWMNASNKLSDDLEFIFPGNSFIGHNYSAPERPWPVGGDGRNLAILKEHNDSDPGSYFIHGKLEDFMGAYWHDASFGFGHWAFYEDMPGRKFFRWSLSRAGAIWGDLLTDTDGQYFEPQTGRLLDQNDHEFLAPNSADQWREIWFPYKKIGPLVTATPHGALNVENAGSSLKIAFCALQKIDEELVIRSEDKEIYRERLALKPMEVYEKKLAVAVRKGSLRVQVGNKLSYTDDPGATALKRPLNFRNYDESSLEGLYLAAERAEKGRDYDSALSKYLRCLEKEPHHIRAFTRIAGLYCRRAEYAKGLEYAHKALDYAMYDPDANYIYGVLSRKIGDLTDAKETLGWAARSMKYRSAAYGELGEIYLLEKDVPRAIEYFHRSLDFNRLNIRTQQTLAATYRRLGEHQKARQTLDAILALDPLNAAARFESYLLDPSERNRKTFAAGIRNEFPHETYLETAVYYAQLGFTDDAVRLLEIAPAHPESLYWLAYLLREKEPARSAETLGKAGALSPYLVFPHRAESIPVYEWAGQATGDQWKPKYYLGLIYWGLRRRADASAVLVSCGQQPDYPPFYVSRAFLERDSDKIQAARDYERALALGKGDWRNWRHLSAFYADQGDHEKALSVSMQAAKLFPDEDLTKIQLARAFLNSGRYQECYGVLEHATILPFEGQRNVHGIFVECQTSLALQELKQARYEKALEHLAGSKEYPERLGTGKPYNPDYRVQDYLAMLCYEKAGDRAQAGESWARIAQQTARFSKRDATSLKTDLQSWVATAMAGTNERDALRRLSLLIRAADKPPVLE